MHGNTANISSELTGSLPFASIADPDKNTGDQIPRAYLNIMFFNERFEFVEEGSMVLRVSQPGDGAAPLVLANIKAPKNGYAYIYLSNENDDAVFWDNFTVSYTRGKIIEENHYYPFGLRIAGISSRKFDGGNEGNLVNHYLYNDKEIFEDADLNWYDYGFRNYDPQIARFTQLDPLIWDYPYYTPYQYAGNEPIANVDLDGLEPLPSVINPGQLFNAPQTLQEIVIKLPGKVSKTLNNLAPSLIGTALKEGSKVAEHKVADDLINQALKGGSKRIGFSLLSKSSLFISLMLTPVETGQELTPSQLYERLNNLKLNTFPSPKFETKMNGPKGEDDDDGFASVRFQVQQGVKNHIANDVQTNTKKNGVTKDQGYSALNKIYADAITKDPFLSKNKNFRSAIIKISKRIKDIKGGIGPGIYQTDLQELFRHNGLQYRIDVEIQRGVNFKK